MTIRLIKLIDVLIRRALENIDEANPDWTFVASRLYLQKLYYHAAKNRQYSPSLKYGDFYQLLELLIQEGIYTPSLLEKYTKDEIITLAGNMDYEKDLQFTYLGLYTLANRYLATDHDKNTYELPQERWMVIAII